MEAYSKEFRRDVLRACDSGKGTREVAVAFKVSESWVRRIKQVRRESGRTAARTTRRRIPKWHAEAERIASIVSKQPDLTLSELQSKLKTKLSVSTLCVALRELKLTFKKKSSERPSSFDRTSPPDGLSGKRGSWESIPIGSSLSMKPGRKRT